ncbi:unnamed protein product [Effrenium voratum]|nr:unnamed protein product [Effrenium voratum]
MGGSSSRERGSTQEAMPSPAQGTPEDEARRRQEKEDEAFARQLWMEEMSTSFGLPGASESSSSSRLSPQGVLLRASCPACGFANQFSPALGAHGQMRVQCSQCSEQFQAALPEPAPQDSGRTASAPTGEHPVRARPALQLCRRCGTLNSSFPPPVPGQQVRCGRCGHVSEAEPRERHRRPVDRPQRALLEALLSEQPQALRGMSGPVVRIPIDGQRQAIPLALLAALMAAAEADKSNPARRSDVAALPTSRPQGLRAVPKGGVSHGLEWFPTKVATPTEAILNKRANLQVACTKLL